MGKHSGPAQDPGQGRRVSLSVLAAVATLLAWAVLVYFAIQIGTRIRGGNSGAWVLLVIAVIGAVACLFLALLIGGRLFEGARTAAHAPHPTGGRRVRR